MSSGFVPGGTIDEPTERDDDWLKAQEAIEATRRRKIEEGKQDGGKSLYEVLQQNKTAKQDAFEESIRLKNQFRSLDEDEVEFLDSVLESTRAKEAEVKKETTEQLEMFRRQREEADKALLNLDTTDGGASAAPADEEQWVTTARKRKRVKETEGFKGVKLRKSSSMGEPPAPQKDKPESTRRAEVAPQKLDTPKKSGVEPQVKDAKPTSGVSRAKDNTSMASTKPDTTLGLGNYSSDDDG